MANNRSLPNVDLARRAVDFFLKNGWSMAQAAGLVANIEAESSFDSQAIGDGGAAVGICQWHPPRQAEFRKAFNSPIEDADYDMQLAFIVLELRNGEIGAGNALRQATSADDAGAIVCKLYERPLDPAGHERRRRGARAPVVQGIRTFPGGLTMNAPTQPAQIAQAIAAAASESAAEAPPGGAVPLAAAVAAEAGLPTTGQQRTVEAAAFEATGVKMPSAVAAAAPKLAFWEQAPNLVLLLVLMYLAIGAVCEISSRNEDYGRVSAHYKWLLSCLNGGSDKGCPTGTKLNDDIDIAVTQVRRYDNLEHRRCGQQMPDRAGHRRDLARASARSCVALTSMPPAEVKPARKSLLAPILSSPWWSFKAAPLQFDQHPKDHLYFSWCWSRPRSAA